MSQSSRKESNSIQTLSLCKREMRRIQGFEGLFGNTVDEEVFLIFDVSSIFMFRGMDTLNEGEIKECINDIQFAIAEAISVIESESALWEPEFVRKIIEEWIGSSVAYDRDR
eukprot:750341-Hanusia_phi.AAC.1